MVGQSLPPGIKPSRSDDVIDSEQQLEITHQVRAHFESVAPKRPTKPNRSEPDPDASLTHHQPPSTPIPELQKLHHLKSLSQTVLSTGGEDAVHEEFVETGYYKQLEIIDKQHHTTGTGFIAIGRGNENGQTNEQQRSSENEGGELGIYAAGYRTRSNPATNDWTPSTEGDNQNVHASTKPSRSG